MIKILVNVDCLIPPLTGVGRYAQGILRVLVQSSEVEDLVGFSTFGLYSRSDLAAILASGAGVRQENSLDQGSGSTSGSHSRARFRALMLRWFNGLKPIIRRLPGIRRLRNVVRTFRVKAQKSRFDDYVYWEPNYLLADLDNPAVAVIHDVSHERMPECHPQDRLTEMALRMPNTLNRSRRLIAVSEFTKNEICNLYHPSQPVDVVRPAVDSEFFEISEAQRLVASKKYNLPTEFIVSVATLEPRKNLLRLIAAFAGLPSELQKRFPLILLGAKGWMTSESTKTLNELLNKGLVRYLGYVEQSDMAPLISLATVSVYPSLYEGFGMPIAEAMAAGTVVITSDAASMPEVAQGAAVLVDPTSVDSIRSALHEILEDPSKRLGLESMGRQVALQYTWGRSAEDLLLSLSAAKVGAS
ncbi:MAG: glycosyltransferase family 1 protein [Limnobacter sp.]|nr:glycosyltransferase family 1 protein [Limnobacter sp.]